MWGILGITIQSFHQAIWGALRVMIDYTPLETFTLN